MTIRGRPIETSFTPGVDGFVTVRCIYRMWWNIGGCGGGVFREQSSVVDYGPLQGPQKLTEQLMTAEYSFGVTAGSLVKVGLAANSGSPYNMNFYDLNLTADFTPT